MNPSKRKRNPPAPKLFSVKTPLQCEPFFSGTYADHANSWIIRDAKGHKLCSLPHSTLFDYKRLAYLFSAAPELHECALTWLSLMNETDYHHVMQNGMKAGEYVKWALAKSDPIKDV